MQQLSDLSAFLPTDLGIPLGSVGIILGRRLDVGADLLPVTPKAFEVLSCKQELLLLIKDASDQPALSEVESQRSRSRSRLRSFYFAHQTGFKLARKRVVGDLKIADRIQGGAGIHVDPKLEKADPIFSLRAQGDPKVGLPFVAEDVHSRSGSVHAGISDWRKEGLLPKARSTTVGLPGLTKREERCIGPLNLPKDLLRAVGIHRLLAGKRLKDAIEVAKTQLRKVIRLL